MRVDYSFYLIMDDSLCSPQAMPAILFSLLDYAVTCVQLRMKKNSQAIIIETALAIQNLLKKKNIPFIINDYVGIAKDVNAEGVHLGQKDMSVLHARNILGEQKIIGLSIENHDQALLCKNFPVDYFGVGPIFHTATKTDAAQPIGLSSLRQMVDILPKPIVALGGITAANAHAVLQTNVAGLGMASFILSSENKTHAAQLIQNIISSRGSA